jgi:hypothetical protein
LDVDYWLLALTCQKIGKTFFRETGREKRPFGEVSHGISFDAMTWRSACKERKSWEGCKVAVGDWLLAAGL